MNLGKSSAFGAIRKVEAYSAYGSYTHGALAFRFFEVGAVEAG